MRHNLARTRRLCAVVGVLALALLSATPASAATPIFDDPPPDRIVVQIVTVIGSGCPIGTAAIAVAPDNTAFTVTYSDYLAQVGVGAKPTDFRKNCQINVAVHAPGGFTFAVAKADYRGFASLARGASATLRANYYFQGHSASEFRSHQIGGDFEDNWQATDETEIAALVFRACGEQRLLNVNTELRVNKGTSDPKKTTSFIAMDSTDGSIDTKYHFHWKRCRN